MQNQANTNKYQNGKIYEIVCNTTGKKYVGSTCTPRLCHRLAEHTYAYRRYLNGKLNYKNSSYKILEGGDYKIYLLESYPCETKEELLKKEREYIEQLDCVNKNIPGRSSKEHYKANKEQILEYKKEYYKANIGKIKEYEKTNKDRITEYKKEYYKANKEKIKEHYKANKQKIKEHSATKVKCTCGCEVARSSLLRHQRSKKHLDKVIQFTDSD